MRPWHLAIVCSALLAAAGCRNDPSVALLERENLDLENQVYELADRVDKRHRENVNLREQLARAGMDAGPADDLDPTSAIAQPTRSRRRPSDRPPDPDNLPSADPEMPSGEISADQFLQRLGVRGTDGFSGGPQFPGEPPPASRAPPSQGPPAESTRSQTPPAEPAPSDHKIAAVDASWELQANNRRAARITLHGPATGGYNMDGRAGDEGIVVVVQPRDAEGRLIEAPAPISVVVLDPAIPGQAARVAHWDFSVEEVAARCRRNGSGEGVRLEMTWPAAPPRHGRLHLFVRYTTDDGRALEADRQIEVDAIGELAQRGPAFRGETPAYEATPAAPQWQGKPDPPATEPSPRSPEARQPDPQRPASRVQRPVWTPERW